MRVLYAVLRWAGVSLLAGVGAGLIMGLCGRMAMRLVALSSPMGPSWSTIGSLSLLLTASAFSTSIALVFVAVRRFIPLRGWRRGLAFGVFSLLVMGYPALFAEAHLVVAEIGLGSTAFGVTMLSCLIVAHGVVLEFLVAGLKGERREVETVETVVAA